MPKPQRLKSQKSNVTRSKIQRTEENCNNLVQEVKKIKLNRNISCNQPKASNDHQPMDCSSPDPSIAQTKRSTSESPQLQNKRPRIQWP